MKSHFFSETTFVLGPTCTLSFFIQIGSCLFLTDYLYSFLFNPGQADLPALCANVCEIPCLTAAASMLEAKVKVLLFTHVIMYLLSQKYQNISIPKASRPATLHSSRAFSTLFSSLPNHAQHTLHPIRALCISRQC